MASCPTTVMFRFITTNCKSLLRKPTDFNVYPSRTYSFIVDEIEISGYMRTENSLDQNQTSEVSDVRNVSGLPLNHYKLYHGQPPDLPYKDLYRKKMMYIQFGSASGEDPRMLWPPRVKLLDKENEEQEESVPLSQRLNQLKSEKEAAEKAKIERRKLIAKNMSQMPKLIEEYKKKAAAAEKVAKEGAAQKEALLQEAKDYFGYKIHASDPKFQKMVEEKALKEKMEKKKLKKEVMLQKQALKQQEELSQMKEMNKEE